MQTITRNDIKRLFKKVKKLYIPENIETVNFDSLLYYSWLDIGQETLYVVCDIRNKLEGIRFDVCISNSGSLKLGYCDVCKSQRRLEDTALVTSKVRNTPKGIVYLVRGRYLCLSFKECNEAIKSRGLKNNLVSLCNSILD